MVAEWFESRTAFDAIPYLIMAVAFMFLAALVARISPPETRLRMCLQRLWLAIRSRLGRGAL